MNRRSCIYTQKVQNINEHYLCFWTSCISLFFAYSIQVNFCLYKELITRYCKCPINCMNYSDTGTPCTSIPFISINRVTFKFLHFYIDQNSCYTSVRYSFSCRMLHGNTSKNMFHRRSMKVECSGSNFTLKYIIVSIIVSILKNLSLSSSLFLSHHSCFFNNTKFQNLFRIPVIYFKHPSSTPKIIKIHIKRG